MFRPFRTRQCACELVLHTNQIFQGHLLVAGQLVPLSCRGEQVEVESGSEEVSNKLESHGLVHGERFLKLNVEFQEVSKIYTLFINEESVYIKIL